jgi:hypothetical protein
MFIENLSFFLRPVSHSAVIRQHAGRPHALKVFAGLSRCSASRSAPSSGGGECCWRHRRADRAVLSRFCSLRACDPDLHYLNDAILRDTKVREFQFHLVFLPKELKWNR